MMKKIVSFALLPLLLFCLPLQAATTAKQPSKPLAELLALLQPLEPDAMELGSGPVDVYVFVDPQCPHSREFVAFIAESDKMRRRYRYHFFLYELKRFHSAGVIAAIYGAADPLRAMLRHMTQGKAVVSVKASAATQAKIVRIAEAAETIGVNKRPYLILNKPPKKARKK